MYIIYTYAYCIDLFYAVIFVLNLDKGKMKEFLEDKSDNKVQHLCWTPIRHLPRHVIICSIKKETVPKFWCTLKCKLSEWRNI